MENPACLVLMPSLEQMAFRKIAIAFYSDPRILASIAAFPFQLNALARNIWLPRFAAYGITSDKRDWRPYVEDAASNLQLPKPLRKEMVTTLKAVGSEIVTWKSIHGEYLSTSTSGQLACLGELCWTAAGSVDYRRTAEGLVRCDALDVAKRLELACLYCLEEAIPQLWGELTDEKKWTFCGEEVIPRFETPHLQMLLPYVLQKQTEVCCRRISSGNSFEKAALCGNRPLAEFCFRNLTEEEREASLVRTVKNVIECRNYEFFDRDSRRGRLSEVLFYLLSLMTPEERVGIFREQACGILRCFLDWPRQDLFSDMADAAWPFLPESQYSDLVSAVDRSITSSGYYFPDVFQNLFLRSPRAFRKRFADEEVEKTTIFWVLFMNEDTETIELIFRNLEAGDRVRLVLSGWSVDLISQSLEMWHVVEAFLRAAALTPEDKRRLKEDVVARLKRRELLQHVGEKLQRFLEFVEES